MIVDLSPFVQVASVIDEIVIPDDRKSKLDFLNKFEQLYYGLAENYITVDDVFTSKDLFKSFDYQPLAMCRTFKQKIWDLQYELGIERKPMEFDRFTTEQQIYVEDNYPGRRAATLFAAAEYGYEQLTGRPYAAYVKDGTCDIYNSKFFDESAFKYVDVDFSNVQFPIKKKIKRDYSEEEIAYMVHYPEVRQGGIRFVRFGHVFDVKATTIFKEDYSHWTREEWYKNGDFNYRETDVLNPHGGMEAVMKYYNEKKDVNPDQGNARKAVETWATGIHREVLMDKESKKQKKRGYSKENSEHYDTKKKLDDELNDILDDVEKEDKDV